MKNLVPGFWYHNDLKKRKYKVFSTNKYNQKNQNRKIETVNKSYSKFLNELVLRLNKIHGTSWSNKSWEVVIGFWLKKYLIIILDRLSTVEEIINKNEKFFFINRKRKKISLNSRSFNDFTNNKVIKDQWNEELIERIYNYKFKKDKKFLDTEKLPDNQKSSGRLFYNFKKKILNIFSKLYVNIFCKNSKLVFSQPYFGNKLKFLNFLLSFKEFPIVYFLDSSEIQSKYNIKLREKISFKIDDSEFHQIASHLIKECLPITYLEGFSEIMKRVKDSSLPKEKKIIFSCQIHNDSMFKFWAASQKEKGAKIILGQHGGGYNFFKTDSKRDYELNICDKFLTWGWDNKKFKNKIIKFSIINNSIFEEESLYGENLFIVMSNYDNYINTSDYLSYLNLINSEKNKNYHELDEVSRFVEKIGDNFKRKIILRPHPSAVRRHSTIVFEKRFNNRIAIDHNFKYPLMKQLKKSRLNFVVRPYSTTFYQSMAKNFPTVTLFPHDFEYLDPSLRKIFKELIKSGICHRNHKNLIKFVEKNFHRVQNWWLNPETQKSKNLYCKNVARVLPNRIPLLRDIINNERKRIQ